MILTAKKFNQEQLAVIADEFYDLLFAGQLTQSRYEEILEVMTANHVMPEIIAGMVAQVPKEWHNAQSRFRLVSS
jgi:hypothetical protein